MAEFYLDDEIRCSIGDLLKILENHHNTLDQTDIGPVQYLQAFFDCNDWHHLKLSSFQFLPKYHDVVVIEEKEAVEAVE